MSHTQASRTTVFRLTLFLFALVIISFPTLVHAQDAQPDVSRYVTVTTANERSTLDRQTRLVTSTADVTITNVSAKVISFPVHAVIEILDTDYANVQMPDALGGPGTAPYGKYYIELTAAGNHTDISPLSTSFGRSACSGACACDTDRDNDVDGLDLARIAAGEKLWPGGNITFSVKFVRSQDIHFRYDIITCGGMETGNTPPVADAGGPYSGHVAEAFTFDGSASTDPDNDPLAFSWDFGDGTTAAGETPMHAYTAAGTYTVTLTVTDGRGGTDTAQAEVVVSLENHSPHFISSPVSQIDEGTAYSYPAAAEDADHDSLAFMLFQGPAGMTLDPESGLLTWPHPAPGAHIIILTVSDGHGGTDTQTFTLTVVEIPNRAPTADAGGPYAALIQEEIRFDGTGSTDPDNDPLTFAWDFGDGTTAVGETPTHAYTTPGDYVVTLHVTDPEGAVDAHEAHAVISDINHPPALAPLEPLTVKEGQPLTFQIAGSDPDSDPLAWSHSALPAGAAFIPATRTFSWAPAFGQAGEYAITFTISDPEGLSASTEVQITVVHVNCAPFLAPVSERRVSETKPLSFHVSATDPDGDPLTYAARNLPQSASFDPDTRTFSWTPPAGYRGTYQVEFTVSDGYLSDSIPVKILVTAFDTAASPSLARIDSRQVDEAQTLSFQVTGSDPNGDTLAYTATGLPEGAVFTATADPDIHNFSWTPDYDQAGIYTVNFTATDPGGLSDTVTVDITVNNVNQPPLADPLPDRNIAETKPLAFHVTASDPDGDEPTCSATDLPSGALFDPNTQTFSWTPAQGQAGAYGVTFTVSDGEAADTTSCAITVIPFDADSSPALTPVENQETDEGQALTFQVTAADPNDDPLIFDAAGLPDGAVFEATADPYIYSFSWTPGFDQAGSYMTTFSVSDPAGNADVMDVRILVNNTNRAPVLDDVSDRTIDEGVELNIILSASDLDQDPLTYGVDPLPEGATLIPETGVFSWTPTFDQAGVYSLTFYAGDGELSDEQPATIEVTDVNRPPVITTATIPDGRTDQPYQAQITALDPDGDELAYTLTASSADMSIDATGLLTWDRPGISDIGEYPLTVQVDDNRGGTDSRGYTLSIPDRIPPAIALNAPARANPGTTVTVEATASDNDGITATAIAGNQSDYPEPYDHSVIRQEPITLPSGIGSFIVHARAWDPSGNTAEATAVIEIEAAFDTTPPQITLNAPSLVSPGQTIPLSASVSDDVGVSTVTFSADGADIGSTSGRDPVMDYRIPDGVPVGSTFQFAATAVDFSGNSAMDTAEAPVADPGQTDTTPPETHTQVPEAVAEEDSIPVTVEVPNETCLSRIEVYVNHTLAATYSAPDPGDFDVPMPDGIEEGMNALVEVVVTDCSGNQTTTSDWIRIAPSGRGIIAGRVYNDRTGLPVEGAQVALMDNNDTVLTAATDALGRYSLAAKAGTARLVITKDGFTLVERTGLSVTKDTGLEVFDARLTPLSDQAVSVSAPIGALVRQAFSMVTAGFTPIIEDTGTGNSALFNKDIELDIPAGALTRDQVMTLTQISPQGLEGMLPAGWSPVAAVSIHPAEVMFQTPADLIVPNPMGFDAGAGIILAVWDKSVHAWRAISTATVSADGSVLHGQIITGGQCAFVLPDTSPQAPPAPQTGELLQGVSPILLPDPVTTTILPEPDIIFYRPGVRSDVGLTISGLPAPIPSGTPVRVHISEEYNAYSGNRVVPDLFVQDIILHSFNRPALVAGFPVTPSHTFEPLTLEQGVIHVDVLAPTDADRTLSIIPPEGGTLTLATGESLTLPEGADNEGVPITLEPLTADDPGIEMPPELSFVGGVRVSFSDHELQTPAALSILVPTGSPDEGRVLLVRLAEIDGVTRLVLAGLGQVRSDRILSVYAVPGNDDLRLDGITAGGRYVFVRTAEEIGFSHGTVIDPSGLPVGGALVLADDLPVVTLSDAAGQYILTVNTGLFSLTAVDLKKMDSGSAVENIPGPDAVTALDIFLTEEPPYVVSAVPANGQENVPLETALTLTFSEPLDAATATADNFILTGPSGPVSGTLSLSSGDTHITFRPSDPLTADTTYTFTALQGIRDMAGYRLESPYVLVFSTLDTTPPPPPPAGAVTATIPDDTGKTTVTATQGTAGPHDTVSVFNRTQGISTPVLVDPDGGFSATVDADIMDEVVIRITDPAGNETVVPVGPFRNPDGSIVVGPAGAQIEVDNGVILDIPEGAFPQGAVVHVTSLGKTEIGVDPGPDFPFMAGFAIESSVAPEIYLNASAPVPDGTRPDAKGIVARVVEVRGEPALAIVDTAKMIDGRLSTASPPCPGIQRRTGRYAMFLNDDQRMRMQQSLVSIVAQGMHAVVLEAFVEAYGGTLESLYPFCAVAGSPQAMAEYYQENCLPVPPDTPLKVVVRDAETGEAIDYADVDPIQPFEHAHFHFNVYNRHDIQSPEVIGTIPTSRILNSDTKRLKIRFSEPVDYMSLLGAGEQDIYLTAENDEKTVYHGTWQLLENNTVIVFEPYGRLPMGKTYRLHLEHIKDMAGNTYDGPPILFSTYKPRIIFPTASDSMDRGTAAAALGVDVQQIPDPFRFKDVDFVTRTPQESWDGRTHTTLAAIQRGLTPGSAYGLFTFDATDPTAPVVTAGFHTDGRFYQSRVRLLDNIQITPREDAWADPQFWKRRHLYYAMADPSIRLCVDPENPDQQRYEEWIARNCRDEDGGCGIIEGGCGDLAVTTTYGSGYSYLWSYDVTRTDDFKWISSRMLSDNGASTYGRHYEAPAGMGFAHGLSLLPGVDIAHGDMVHENTVGAYVATTGIGLELVDLGLNIPTINDDERQSASQYPWGHAETLHLNTQLYYQDVAVIPPVLNAYDSVIPPRVVAIAADLKDGTDIATLEIFRADLAGEPTGLVRLPRLPAHVAIAARIPVRDDITSEPTPRDLAVVSSENGGIFLYDIPEDGSTPQRFSFVDTPPGVITKHVAVDARAMLAYVGASNVNNATGGDGILIVDISQPFDPREDKDGDGWNDRIIGILPVTVPGYAGPVEVLGFRVDPERGLLYAGIQADGQQPLVIAKLRECPDLSIDFKAVGEPEPVPGYAEKQALLQVVENGIIQSGMPTGSVAVLAYGDRACLWKGGCSDETRGKDPRYRFAVLIPEAQWGERQSLLSELRNQVIDLDGQPRPVEAAGVRVTFHDIKFTPVQWEAFVAGDPGIDPEGENEGLATRVQLLEMLLNGAWVTDSDVLRDNPIPVDLVISLLTDSCDPGECATEEPSHIWRQEGYELAKLQKAAFFRSGVLIRFHGESETGTTLQAAWRKDLREVARMALQAALARLIANEDGNHFVAFRADTYKGLGPAVAVGDSPDPDTWETDGTCTSIEQWIAATAALSVVNQTGVFSPEEIVNQVSRFQQVADGETTFDSETDANAFIAMAWNFVEDTINGPAWAVYQARLMDDPDQAQRAANMAAVEARITEFQQTGRKEIIPRVVNNGPLDITGVWCRMYEKDNGSGNAVERIRVKPDMNAGAEMHLPRGTFKLENINQTDTDLTGWRMFTLDIPERSVEEPDRDNNRVNLLFYVLDPANPAVPDLPPEPGLPVDDPTGDMLEPDAKCVCKTPELNILMSAGGRDTLELLPGDCIDIEVQIENIGDAALSNIRLYSTLPGMEDWTYDLSRLAAGEGISLAVNYCVPEGRENLKGYVWFQETDEEYDAPPAVSNPLDINVIPPPINLIAKANGKNEIFVGKDRGVTFSAAYDQDNCANPVFFWDMGDGKGIFTGASPTYAYDKGGTYIAKARVTCGDLQEVDTVTVHVVEVEILVNDTLDDPDISGDDGELDDAVRLKTNLPPGHPEGLTTRVFTTLCSARLKHPLTKDVSIMLKSSEARVGFADWDIENPLSQATWQLTLPKSGESVGFAVTGEQRSDLLNDARILALLEDSDPPVGEEDLTVFWFDNAHMDLEVAGVYTIRNDRLELDPNLNPNSVLPDADFAVWMKGKAHLEPQGACSLKPIEQLRIGISQAARDWEAYTDYSMPVPVFAAGADPDTGIDIPAEIRVSTTWPENVTQSGWINDGDKDSDPLYVKILKIDPTKPTVARPPAPCPGSTYQYTAGGKTYSDNGIWLVDGPGGPVGESVWPPVTENPIPVYLSGGHTFIELDGMVYDSTDMTEVALLPVDAQLVAHLRYGKLKAAGRKEHFRDWVVVYWRQLPFDVPGGVEEIIPLRESEWWLDIHVEKDNLPTPGHIDPLTHQARTWGYDVEPRHMPITGPPYPNQFQFNATDPSNRPVVRGEPIGGSTTIVNSN